MKFNKTVALLQSTSSYTQFKTYSNAGINEPYIAGVFSTSQYQQMKHFTLGKKPDLFQEFLSRRSYCQVNRSKQVVSINFNNFSVV